MPRPTNPPPANDAGALTQPRQLQRWLGHNLVHKLTRTQTYLQLPAFSVESAWKGYSEIIACFNYTSPNNFSLKQVTQPEDANYVVCIMWVDEDLNVYRYRLWEDVGEVFYFNPPLYTGQKIMANFRIEIWNVEPKDYDTLTVVGSGDASSNGDYEVFDATTWSNVTTGPANIDFIGLDAILYNVSGEAYNTANFPFGLWNTDTFGTNPPPYLQVTYSAILAEASNFFTSVLGGYDYRYQDDSALAEPSAIITDFSAVLDGGGVFPLPITWPAASVPATN